MKHRLNERGEAIGTLLWALTVTIALALALRILFDVNLFDHLARATDIADAWLKERF